MAHFLLQDNTVTEMYVSDGKVVGSKNILMLHKDGTLELRYCHGDKVETQPNASLVRVGRRLLLEYGEPNLLNVMDRVVFLDEQGNLDGSWEKIM